MLFLLFYAGEDRYAIDASHAVEVLPLVAWKRLPGAPKGVAGIFNYHGTPVPLIDLSELITPSVSRSWMSTRIIVIDRNPGAGNTPQLLGLLAERATETLRHSEQDFVEAGIASPETPFLGRVAVRASGMLQRIDLERLLPAGLQAQLFGEKAGCA